MPQSTDRILVAVSGGVDSVYLLHLLSITNEVGIAHFNHNLRPESAMEQKFVERLANRYKCPIYVGSADVNQYCKDNKVSIELGARELRRAFLANTMRNEKYDWLALGHHVNDQAETVLLNLMRGSGIHGLSAMKEVDDEHKIIRPLLKMTKDNIYKCAKELDLRWYEDSSNKSLKFDRNWVRNFLLVKMQTRRRGVVETLADAADRFSSMSDYFKRQSRQWIDTHVTANKFLATSLLAEHPAMQAEIIRELWEDRHGRCTNFTSKRVYEVIKWLSSNPDGGSKIHFGEYDMTIRKGEVFIIDKPEQGV
jgi:tRNA(Ile)-lysidine synthase